MSSWASLDAATDNRPAKLTPSQIKEIISVIPVIPVGDDESTAIAANGARDALAKQLKSVVICPSGIEELTDRLVEAWCQAVSTPGTSIGTNAAEAIGSLLTQVMLNAFHLSGTAGGKDVGNINSVIRAAAVDNKSNLMIHFEDKYTTYMRALDYVGQLECVSLRQILLKDHGFSILALRKIPGSPHRRVVEARDTVFDEQTLDTLEVDSFLRLRLDIDAMYRYRISPLDIQRIMSNRAEGRGFIVAARHRSRFIDISLDPKELEEIVKNHGYGGDYDTWAESKAVARYMDVFVKNMDAAIIRGIPGKKRGSGTHDIHPVKNVRLYQEPILGLIEEVSARKGYAYYRIKPEEGAAFGLEYDRVIHALDAIEIPNKLVVSKGTYYIRVSAEYTMEDMLARQQTAKDDFFQGTAKLNRLVREDEARVKADMARGVKAKAMSVKPFTMSPVLDALNLVYARASGNNLSGVLSLEFVDRRRTTSTSIHAMATYLGIEACRSTVITDFETEFDGRNSKIHPAYLRFIAENITNRGTPTGAGYAGMSKFGFGHMSLSMVERASAVMAATAIRGDVESVKNTSAAIATGSVVGVGSGYSSIEDKSILINGRPARDRGILDYVDYKDTRKVSNQNLQIATGEYVDAFTDIAAEDEMAVIENPTDYTTKVDLGTFLNVEVNESVPRKIAKNVQLPFEGPESAKPVPLSKAVPSLLAGLTLSDFSFSKSRA